MTRGKSIMEIFCQNAHFSNVLIVRGSEFKR
jgi:hypothetical protein